MRRRHLLIATRRRLGLTQRDIANQLGMSDRTISMIEVGDRTPSLDVALAITGILNALLPKSAQVSVERLFGDRINEG